MSKYEWKKMWVTEDGYPFYLQDDGSLTCAPDPEKSEMSFNNFEQMADCIDYKVATVEDHIRYAKIRLRHAHWIAEEHPGYAEVSDWDLVNSFSDGCPWEKDDMWEG